jgi:REP element-mobilizing transposase RayT
LPRAAREKSSTGIYHIMLRGINKQDIFNDDEDRERFLETIQRYKKETGFQLYAYCLMDNHVHLIIRENDMELSKVMKRIGTSYAGYFNWKYGRSGHLFQNRYCSEAVENDSYLYMVIRYIHQNPAKAGICAVNEYKWSSYNCYISESSVIDKDIFLNMFNEDRRL